LLDIACELLTQDTREEFHFTFVQDGFFDGIIRSKLVIDHRAGSQVLQLRLHHPAFVTWSQMVKPNDSEQLVPVKDDVSASQVCSLNRL